jgi:hypothetical protein
MVVAHRNVLMNCKTELQKPKKWFLETAGSTGKVWL